MVDVSNQTNPDPEPQLQPEPQPQLQPELGTKPQPEPGPSLALSPRTMEELNDNEGTVSFKVEFSSHCKLASQIL